MLILGAHVSIGGGFASAAEKTGKEYGCNAMQIFTKSPQGGPVKKIDPEDAAEFKRIRTEYKNKSVIAHSPCLLNFAKPLKSLPWMKTNMLLDFERLALLGGDGVVVHIGKSLDTAHAWGAGYDAGTAAGAQQTLKEYDQYVGLDTLACFHFNDSKKDLSSRVDRHDNIGDGRIGLEGLTTIARFAKEKSIPLILETPEKGAKTRLEDIKKVRDMCG